MASTRVCRVVWDRNKDKVKAGVLTEEVEVEVDRPPIAERARKGGPRQGKKLPLGREPTCSACNSSAVDRYT